MSIFGLNNKAHRNASKEGGEDNSNTSKAEGISKDSQQPKSMSESYNESFAKETWKAFYIIKLQEAIYNSINGIVNSNRDVKNIRRQAIENPDSIPLLSSTNEKALVQLKNILQEYHNNPLKDDFKEIVSFVEDKEVPENETNQNNAATDVNKNSEEEENKTLQQKEEIIKHDERILQIETIEDVCEAIENRTTGLFDILEKTARRVIGNLQNQMRWFPLYYHLTDKVSVIIVGIVAYLAGRHHDDPDEHMFLMAIVMATIPWMVTSITWAISEMIEDKEQNKSDSPQNEN